jgi:hypothetical protein
MIETPTVEPLETKTGFLKDICAYFRDFLDTDFKRQSAPKRNITLKDPAGNLTGIDGAKYPDLTNEVWRLLRKPIDDNSAFSLAVPRGRYCGRLRTALKELIEKHAEALSEDDLQAIADRGSVTARGLKAQLENDPDRYAETVTNAVKSDLVRMIVVPLLTKLEAALARARGDAFEAMYNIEEELGERLIGRGASLSDRHWRQPWWKTRSRSWMGFFVTWWIQSLSKERLRPILTPLLQRIFFRSCTSSARH